MLTINSIYKSLQGILISSALLFLVIPFLGLISLLPTPIIGVLSQLCGYVIYKSNPQRSRIARRNIHLCFPEWSKSRQEELVKKNHQQLLLNILGNFIALLQPKRFARLVDLHNEQLLQEYGKNTLFIGIHMLSLHTVAHYVCRMKIIKDVVVHILFKPPRYISIWFLKKLVFKRPRGFAPAIVHNRKGFSQAIRGFSKMGGLFQLSLDQDLGVYNSVAAPFFAVDNAATTVTVLRVAKKYDANIFFCTGYWLNGRYQLHFDPPLKNFPTNDEKQNAVLLNKQFESMIMQAPEQYLWFHKRFKTCLEGAAPRYTELT